MIPKRPLLAATIEHPDELANLQLPVLLSEKKDGIRAITDGKGVLSRSLKRIPNDWVNLLLSGTPPGIEGELVAQDCEGNDADFEDTESAIMSQDGQPSFKFYVFDWFGKTKFEPYKYRHQRLKEFCESEENICSEIFLLQQYRCDEIWEIHDLYTEFIGRGAEGVILRDPYGFYKFGRSTLNEQLLIKYKPWNTDEATVIEVLEEMENRNTKTKDERGLSKRSKHIANLQGKGTMGALLCRNKRFGKFKLGSGFTDEMAQEIYNEFHDTGLNLSGGMKLQFRYRGITKYGKPKHAAFVKWMN